MTLKELEVSLGVVCIHTCKAVGSLAQNDKTN